MGVFRHRQTSRVRRLRSRWIPGYQAVQVSDTLDNSATLTALLVENVAEGQAQTGVGTTSISEVISESITNSASATIQISDFQSEEEQNSGTGSPTITEDVSESTEASQAASQDVSESISEEISNSASATIQIADFETEEEINTGTGSSTISESIAEEILSSAESTQETVDILNISDDEDNSGSGSQDIFEAISEFIDNSAESTQAITELAPETNMTSAGQGSQTLSEAISETIDVSANSDQSISEAIFDSLDSSATSTQDISDVFGDDISNEGESDNELSESTAETDTILVSASHSIEESRHIRVVPFSDISTGTWTVDPLYEKVDELVAIAGYPDESIRSGNSPSNDAAVLALSPASDPGIDTDHFINIEFYKMGEETLDFTVNLKEGSTLIATRTYEDVQETASSPRSERIELTEDEVDDIVDYSNLRIELIANQTS